MYNTCHIYTDLLDFFEYQKRHDHCHKKPFVHSNTFIVKCILLELMHDRERYLNMEMCENLHGMRG